MLVTVAPTRLCSEAKLDDWKKVTLEGNWLDDIVCNWVESNWLPMPTVKIAIPLSLALLVRVVRRSGCAGLTSEDWAERMTRMLRAFGRSPWGAENMSLMAYNKVS